MSNDADTARSRISVHVFAQGLKQGFPYKTSRFLPCEALRAIPAETIQARLSCQRIWIFCYRQPYALSFFFASAHAVHRLDTRSALRAATLQAACSRRPNLLDAARRLERKKKISRVALRAARHNSNPVPLAPRAPAMSQNMRAHSRRTARRAAAIHLRRKKSGFRMSLHFPQRTRDRGRSGPASRQTKPLDTPQEADAPGKSSRTITCGRICALFKDSSPSAEHPPSAAMRRERRYCPPRSRYRVRGCIRARSCRRRYCR